MPKYGGTAIVTATFILEFDKYDSIEAEDSVEARELMQEEMRSYVMSGDAFRDKNFQIEDITIDDVCEYEAEPEEEAESS